MSKNSLRSKAKLSIFVPSICSIILGITVRTTPEFPIDFQITSFLQSFNFPWIVSTMKAISWPGDSLNLLFIILICVGLLLQRKLKLEAAILSLSSLAALLLSTTIKIATDRPRPDSNAFQVFVNLHDKSFPSGHVLEYTVVFGFLSYLIYRHLHNSHYQKLFIALLFLLSLLILLIGFSRVYLGAHFFTDTIGAYLIGGALLVVSIKLYLKCGRTRSIM